MEPTPIHLSFDSGTVVLRGADPEQLLQLPGCRFDPRTSTHRAEGRWYRAIVEHLRQQKIKYTDEARAYQPTPWTLRGERRPFPHQSDAVETWWRQNGRG